MIALSGGKTHTAQEVWITRVRAQAVHGGIHLQPGEALVACIVGFFEPLDRSHFVTQSRIDSRHKIGSDELTGSALLELAEELVHASPITMNRGGVSETGNGPWTVLQPEGFGQLHIGDGHFVLLEVGPAEV